MGARSADHGRIAFVVHIHRDLLHAVVLMRDDEGDGWAMVLQIRAAGNQVWQEIRELLATVA